MANKENSPVTPDETKIKCYELDFGDTNLISEHKKDILDWISYDMDTLEGSDELNYVINIKMLTRAEIDALPEWQ